MRPHRLDQPPGDFLFTPTPALRRCGGVRGAGNQKRRKGAVGDVRMREEAVTASLSEKFVDTTPPQRRDARRCGSIDG